MDIEIAETIYHAFVAESVALAKVHGPYKYFQGSPASQGRLHYSLWMENRQLMGLPHVDPRSARYDWAALEADVKLYGMRNSLGIANMPTASTSQIFSNSESFEPYQSNIFSKNTLTGKCPLINTAMVTHLIELGLWNDDIRNTIINNNGSIQSIEHIPAEVREIYKTVWEIGQKGLMLRAALRAAFVDQSSSLNIRVPEITSAICRDMMFTGWKNGLKTGSYYVQARPQAQAMKTNIAQSQAKIAAIQSQSCPVDCTNCSS